MPINWFFKSGADLKKSFKKGPVITILLVIFAIVVGIIVMLANGYFGKLGSDFSNQKAEYPCNGNVIAGNEFNGSNTGLDYEGKGDNIPCLIDNKFNNVKIGAYIRTP